MNIKESLEAIMTLDGAIGASVVDYTSGMMLATAGGGSLNLEIASAGNMEVVRAKMKTMKALGLNEKIEDILITLGTQYHMIRLIEKKTGIFIYVALHSNKANLAMARMKLREVEESITF